MASCINTNSPEYKEAFDKLLPKLGLNTLFEMKRDFYTNGEVLQTAEYTINRVSQEVFSIVPKPRTLLLRQLQKLNLISQNRAPESMQTVEGMTVYSIPKSGAERDKHRAFRLDVESVQTTKDYKDLKRLMDFITVNNIDWIKVSDKKNFFSVEIPNEVYDQSLAKNEAKNDNEFFSAYQKYKRLEEEAMAEQRTEQSEALNVSYYRPSAQEVMEEVLDVQDDLTGLTTSNNRAREIAAKLANQLGIEYATISSEEATALTKDTESPWNGEPALFIGGKVYFVGEGLSTKTALHEFAHPLIRSIAVNNPILLNKMFAELSASQEGREILERVRADYKTLEEGSDSFKEEALVFALQYASEKAFAKVELSSPFAKFLNNLLYSIKTMLRKAFGVAAKVEKLDQDTTINELAVMLAEGGNFNINIEDVNQADVASYMRKSEESVKDLLGVPNKEILSLVNSAFDKMKRHIADIKNRKDYDAAVNLFTNQFSSGELDLISKTLKYDQSRILEVLDGKISEVEEVQSRVNALVKTIGHLQNLTAQIKKELAVISKDINNPDTIGRVTFLKSTLEYWSNFLKEADDVVIDKTSAIYDNLQEIRSNISTAENIIEAVQKQAATEAIVSTLQSTADNITALYEKERAALVAKKADKKFLDELDAKYERDKITVEKIKGALDGSLGDIGIIGAAMVGYSFNSDPVVGGLAKYVKNKMMEADAEIYNNYNNFINHIEPDLKANNFNPNNEGEIGEKLGFKDRVGTVNDKGEFEIREVWRFLNPFQGHDLVADEYRFKIKQAGDKYAESQTEEDKKILYDLEAAWRQHKIEFFHQKYKPEFYETFNLFEKDEIGKEAGLLQDEIYRKIQAAFNSPTNSLTELEVLNEVARYKRDLKRLADVRDVAGREKVGKELAIAQRLQEFKEASKEFYESEEIPGAFQKALKDYEAQLISEGVEPGGERWVERRDQWIDKNTVKSLTPEFWENRKRIVDDIKTITSLMPQDQQALLDVEEANNKLREVMFGYKDEAGQPLGGEMSKERLAEVKAAQERLMEAKEYLRKMGGLTAKEQDELTGLLRLAHSGSASQDVVDRIIELRSKKVSSGLGNLSWSKLMDLYEELEELQSTVPTDDYIDVVNDWLSSLDTGELFAQYRINSIDKGTESILRSDKVLTELFKGNPEFEEWYKANHIKRKRFDKMSGEEKDVWERIYAWNTIEPKSDSYYEKTQLKNEAGVVVETIKGKPAGKFFKTTVKSEYLTPKIVGQTVDNRGQWLPKTVAQGAKDGRYRNDAFFRMAVDNPTQFKLLEKMKADHVKFQSNAALGNNDKLWMDFPRDRKQGIEKLQSKNPFARFIDGIKLFWQNRKDAIGSDLNNNANLNLVRLDVFNTKSSKVPVIGLADIPVDEVSTNLPLTMMKYMASITRAAKMKEMQPTVNAIQDTLNNKKNFPIVEKAFKNRVISFWDDKKNKYIRAQAVNNYIERDFEGIINSGVFSENALAQNASKFLFGKASFAFLALNIPSAIKNAVGMKFQGMIEAAAGKHLTPLELIKAEKWATHVAMVNSVEVYKKGTKSLGVQIADIFDFEVGKTTDDIGKSLSRTVGKDSAKVIERLGDFRKWTQYQAALQTGGAMLMHQKIQKEDGTWTDYLDAWELNQEGKITLKPGIDPTWGLTYDAEGNVKVGEKFKAKKAEMQRVLENLNGAMSRESAPDAQRYLLYRYVSFMRRWFTGQLLNRFSHTGNILKGTATGRADYLLGESKEGFYITTLKLFAKTAKNVGKNLKYMTAEEKQASLRFITEVGSLLLLSGLAALIFGYDDDDEDRFKKLLAKSGPLPTLFVDEDPEHPFQASGWLSNQMLLLMLQVRGENEQFNVFAGGANDYMSLLDVKSLALSPTVKVYYDVSKDLTNMLTGDEDAYWKRDASVYNFGEKGDAKVWKHLAKGLGVTGSTVDPVRALRGFESIQNQ